MKTSLICLTDWPVVAGAWLMCLALPVAAHEDHVHTGESTLDQAIEAQARHDFDRALALTNQSLAERRDNDAAWLQRMALHLIRGETAAAREACGELRHSSALVMVTCQARIAHAMGESRTAGPRLERLLEATDTTAIPGQLLGWSHSVAGDLAYASDKLAAAKTWYRQSLALHDNPQVRASLVDVLIDQGHWQAARQALGDGRASLTLEVQALIVARHAGEDIKDRQRQLAHQFEHWIEDGDYEHAREMARFYLDVVGDLSRARQLAQINAGLQHEPEDRRLLERTM